MRNSAGKKNEGRPHTILLNTIPIKREASKGSSRNFASTIKRI